MTKEGYINLKKYFAKSMNPRDFYIKRFHSGMVWMGAPTCKIGKFREHQEALRRQGFVFGYINPYLVRVDDDQ